MKSSTPEELDLDASWCITERGFALLVERLKAAGPMQRIIEFGSGRSTIRLGFEFPETAIVSLENDYNRFCETEELRRRYCPNGQITILHRGLASHSDAPPRLFSYEYERSLGEYAVDCVIIDGPPFYTLRGRELCLYQCYSALKTGGLVLLDDYCRDGERAMVANWLSVYSGALEFVEILPSAHQIAVLTKVRSTEPDWDSPTLVHDRKLVAETRRHIRDSLLHLDDEAWLRFLRTSPSTGETPERFLETVRQIRLCYDVTPSDIAGVRADDQRLSTQEQQRLIVKCFQILRKELS